MTMFTKRLQKAKLYLNPLMFVQSQYINQILLTGAPQITIFEEIHDSFALSETRLTYMVLLI